MKAVKIDFSELELREIGSWPFVLRVAVMVGASIAGIILVYILILSGQTDKLSADETQELSKRSDFRDKYDLAANLDAYQQQMAEINAEYKVLSAQLPSDSDIPDLIESISKIAESNNLKYESIKLGDPDSVSGFYKELPIDLTLLGKYHDFGRFVRDISKLPRIVTVHDFSIVTKDKDKNDGSILEMKVNVKTYWLSSDPVTPVGKAGAAPLPPSQPFSPGAKGTPPPLPTRAAPPVPEIK